MTRSINVAVVGATGAVGEVMLALLEQRQFPVGKLYPLASERSQGKHVEFCNKQIKVELLDTFDFSTADLALFSAGGSISAIHAPRAAAAGCIVVDNTSHFRYEKDIPLIVPEVNPEALELYAKRKIIANPNCSTIQMVVALKPLYDEVGIERINVATYQAVSGAGAKAVDELAKQTMDLLNTKNVTKKVFPHQIAFNVIPHIDVFQENGYTKEEMKLVWETRKLLNDDKIMVNPTTVRVPVFYGHSEAVHIETRQKCTADQARYILNNAPGVVVMDEVKKAIYPTPYEQGSGHDAVYVGRIREDISHPRGLNLWIVSDNLRKGAALNAVQIAELLLERGTW